MTSRVLTSEQLRLIKTKGIWRRSGKCDGGEKQRRKVKEPIRRVWRSLGMTKKKSPAAWQIRVPEFDFEQDQSICVSSIGMDRLIQINNEDDDRENEFVFFFFVKWKWLGQKNNNFYENINFWWECEISLSVLPSKITFQLQNWFFFVLT